VLIGVDEEVTLREDCDDIAQLLPYAIVVFFVFRIDM